MESGKWKMKLIKEKIVLVGGGGEWKVGSGKWKMKLIKGKNKLIKGEIVLVGGGVNSPGPQISQT